MDTQDNNIQTMLRIFEAVEERDDKSMLNLCQQDVEFCWPRSLPYGGDLRGLDRSGPTWGETWIPLQPTEAERQMHPRVVAASENEVVVLWCQRGITSSGERFEGEVLGLYRLRDGKLARAQMFYFDTQAVLDFLSKVKPLGR